MAKYNLYLKPPSKEKIKIDVHFEIYEEDFFKRRN
jgi:hypothetical protein